MLYGMYYIYKNNMYVCVCVCVCVYIYIKDFVSIGIKCVCVY